MAYLSTSTGSAETEVDEILAASRRNNAAHNVTGMLCHYDGSFLQFLEGEAADVDATFSRIAADRRHHGVLALYRAEIPARLFPDWSMALARPDAVSPEQRAFCQGLRGIEAGATPDHRRLVDPFLDAFRAWLR